MKNLPRSAHTSVAARRLAVAFGLAVALLSASSAGARAVLLDEAAERYRPYMIEDVARALAGARTLRDRVLARDVEGARQAWIEARVGWERAEVFTSGFVPDLDEKIDGWPNATTGFHAIEARLFAAGATDDLAPEADKLILYLTDLDLKIHYIRLTPQGLLDGTARLAYEVGESKADGGESRISGTSLDDMVNNLVGLEQAYSTVFAASLETQDIDLAHQARARIEQLTGLLQVGDLKRLDGQKLRAASEELVVTLQQAAATLGMRKPTLEVLVQ